VFLVSLAATVTAGLAAGTVTKVIGDADVRHPIMTDLIWAAAAFLLVAFTLALAALVRNGGRADRLGHETALPLDSRYGKFAPAATPGTGVSVSIASRTSLGELARVPDIDLVLALSAFVALLADPLQLRHVSELTPTMGVLALLTAVPLAFRRRSPLLVLATEMPLLMAYLALYHPNRAALGIAMLLVFTAGLEGKRLWSLQVGAAMALIVTAAVFVTGQHPNASDVVAFSALVLGALIAGDALRARQALQRLMAEEAARAREAAARHRFDQERLLLAHELHDVIGHTLVAVNVRAGAAAHRARKSNAGQGAEILEEIASISAEALSELRTTLKMLRAEHDGPAPLQPIQDLADLSDLVGGVRDAGLDVALEVAGDLGALPSPIGHAGYRIVQEGLTNVLRHSTARTARVRIDVGELLLLIEIADDGPPGAVNGHVPGHGLQGMRDRTDALGGTCESGPLGAAGWRVRAEIPLVNGEA
jgi:signal transduction histidine kinase